MKKLPAIAAGVVLIGAAGWSALWFAGRGAVAERLDVEIAALRAQGFQIEHGTREIGGFPFGYRVTHRDVTLRLPGGSTIDGAAYLMPEISTEVTAADVDRLVTRFPAKFRIEAPVPAAQRAASPDLPEVLAFDIEAANLVLVSDGVPGIDQDLAITADSLLLVTAVAIQDVNVAVEFVGLAFVISLPPRNSGMPVTTRTVVDRLDYGYAVVSEGGGTFAVEGSVEGLRLTGNTDVANADAMLAMLTQGIGNYAVAYQTGASTGVVTSRGGADQPARSMYFTAGSAAGTVKLANGRAEVNAASQANRVTWTMPAAIAPAADGASTGTGAPPMVTFGGALRAIELHYAAPMAPADQMTPVLLRLALDQIALDEALWERIDVNGKLPRDPARLVLDIEGSARFTAPLTAQRPGAAPPVELGNFTIRAADLTALGAGLTTRGDIEFLQPIQQPIGTVTVTVTNVMQLLGKLAETGLIDRTMAQTAILMATGFTVAGEADGERVAKIELTLDGVSVNGQPMWQ